MEKILAEDKRRIEEFKVLTKDMPKVNKEGKSPYVITLTKAIEK